MMQRPVLIMAGGTGGHVFPALAVAEELRQRDVPVIWLGTRQGLEARVVPEAGIRMEWISVAGVRGKAVTRRLLAPFMLVRAAWQSMRVISRHRPVAVLGMGGFVAGPGGVVAKLLGKRLCIHEQNAIAGLTNRWLSRIANVVLTAFPDAIRSKKAVHVGNPVRADIAAIAEPAQRMENRTGVLRLLVVGGSLGARTLNTVVPAAIAGMDVSARPQIRHQTGSRNLEYTQARYHDNGVKADVIAFIDDMAEAYAWADLVICRAGALTVSELAAAGVASILVPYPYAVDDHQTANGLFLVEAGAAELVQESALTEAGLRELIEDCSDREQLQQMAVAARSLALPDAVVQVADACLQQGVFAKGGRS